MVYGTEGRSGLVDPAALCWGLKRAILSLGVRVYEGTPLLKMQTESGGMKIDCPKGTVRCEKVLIGTNAFRNPVAKARRTVIPVWDYAVATEPLSTAQRESIGWKRRQGVSQEVNMFHLLPPDPGRSDHLGRWNHCLLLLWKPPRRFGGGPSRTL